MMTLNLTNVANGVTEGQIAVPETSCANRALREGEH
jgi:hypothetical protein